MHSTRIGIIADTHDNRIAIQKAVALFNERRVSLVLHAGDCVSPFTVMDFQTLTCPMELVYGNNDGERIGLHKAFSALGTIAPGPRLITFAGKTILLTHEHDCLQAYTGCTTVDLVVYGHTHTVDVREATPRIVNPGEAGGWLSGRSTVAVVDCATWAIEICDLAP